MWRQDPDQTYLAEDRLTQLSKHLHALRLEATPSCLKMDTWEVNDDSLKQFNALFPGLVSRADIDGIQRPDKYVATALADVSVAVSDAVATSSSSDSNGAASASAAGDAADAGTDEVKREGAGEPAYLADPRHSLPDDEHAVANLKFDTIRTLRHAELIANRSADADIVFVVLPPPRSTYPTGLYTAWLEVLSSAVNRPCVLIRGNGTTVVTAES